MTDRRELLVDTDTATDDAVALLLAALSDRAVVEGVTAVAGNVPLERAAENAKYVLDLAGVDATVYEGARAPLLKGFETAEDVHGEGGLGGELVPDTGVPSGEEHAAEYLVRAARERPGERTLVCLGPLTNVALALAREPDLGEYLADVWVMGGARNTLGNVTPAAEYNFWVDPDAAKRALRDLEVTLVDWGVCRRDGTLDGEAIDRVVAAADDSRFADFFATIVPRVREFSTGTHGVDGVVVPDALAVALLLEPELLGSAAAYHVDVDEREGLTRGYSAVDEAGVLDAPARTRVVEAADADGFRRQVVDALVRGDPHPA